MTVSGIFDNEASSVDMGAYSGLRVLRRALESFDEVNQQFDGRLKEVIEDVRGSFKLAV